MYEVKTVGTDTEANVFLANGWHVVSCQPGMGFVVGKTTNVAEAGLDIAAERPKPRIGFISEQSATPKAR
jgi:hypothetical protein